MGAISYRDPKASKDRINAFAQKVLRRLHALGARSHSVEDVRQELWIAWCKACESYDPAAGASFETYLYRGMQLHINRYVEKNFERFHDETVALSLDYQKSGGGEGEDDSLYAEEIPDGRLNAEEELCRESTFDYALSRLSRRARLFVTFLKEQPAELIEELRKLEAKGEFARERGIPCPVPHRISTSIVFDLMGASRSERKNILDEVRQLGELLTGQAA